MWGGVRERLWRANGGASCRADSKPRDHFSEAGCYGDTVLVDEDSIESKLLYIWLNPVRAGLVERAETGRDSR